MQRLSHVCVFRKFFKIIEMPAPLLFFYFLFKNFMKFFKSFVNLMNYCRCEYFSFLLQRTFRTLLSRVAWDFLFRTIYLDIASIKIYYSSLAERSYTYFFVAVRECQLPSEVPSAGYKPDAIVRSTILGRTAHNISHSHIIHPLYIAPVRLLPSPRATGGKAEPEQS